MYEPKVKSSLIADYMGKLNASSGVEVDSGSLTPCTTRLNKKTLSLVDRLAAQIGESRSSFMGDCVERSVYDLARELGWLDEYDQEIKED